MRRSLLALCLVASACRFPLHPDKVAATALQQCGLDEAYQPLTGKCGPGCTNLSYQPIRGFLARPRDHWYCATGRTCVSGSCQVPCQDSQCRGGYVCGSDNQCEDYCLYDDDCQDGFVCCSSSSSAPVCDGRESLTCVRRRGGGGDTGPHTGF